MARGSGSIGRRPGWLSLLLDLPAFLLAIFILYWSSALGAALGYIRFTKMRGLRDDTFEWSKFMLHAFAVRIVRLGPVLPYRQSPCMYLCNHRSWADFFVDTYCTEGRSALMSRWLVWWVFPVFMSVCRIIGGVVLFKRGAVFDKEKFNAWIDKRLTEVPGHSLLVFPEGHRSISSSSLVLKRGMLHYAHSRKLPVQVVLSAGKEGVLSETRQCVRFGRTVVVTYADVIKSGDFPNFDDFLATVQSTWEEKWRQVHSAPKDGLPALDPVGMSFEYTPTTRWRHVAATLSSYVFMAVVLYASWQAAAYALLAMGPLAPVISTILVVWSAVSLTLAWLPERTPSARHWAAPATNGPVASSPVD